MDKRKNLQSILPMTVLLMLLLFAGEASASFKSCFEGCAVGCFLGKNKALCTLKCIGKCIIRGGGTSPSKPYDCKLKCAMERCAHFTNDFKMEDVDKVDRCVNECEIGTCRISTQATTAATSEESSLAGAP